MTKETNTAIAERHLRLADEHIDHAAQIGDEIPHLVLAAQSTSVALHALLAKISRLETIIQRQQELG